MSGSDQELEAFFKKKKLKSKKKAVVKIDDIGKQLDQHTMEELNPINSVKDFSKPVKELYGQAWKVEVKEETVEVLPVDSKPAKYVPAFKQAAAKSVLNVKSEKMFPSISEADKLAKELAMTEKLEQEKIYATKLREELADRLEKAKNAPKKCELPKEEKKQPPEEEKKSKYIPPHRKKN